MKWALVVVAAVGCGRVGFDEPPVVAIAVPGPFTTTASEFVAIPGASLVIPASQRATLMVASAALSSTLFSLVTVELRYVIDGVEGGLGGTESSAIGKPGPWQHFIVLPPSDAPRTIEFQLRNAPGGQATVEQLAAVAVELDERAVYAPQDGVVDVTATAYASVATFTMTLEPVEYLFLAVVNTSDAPGQSDCFHRWRGLDGAVRFREFQMPRDSLQTSLAGWRETAPGGLSQLGLEAHVSSGTSRVRDPRVLALPIDALAIDVAIGSDRIRTNSPQPVTTSELVGGGARSLVVASERMETDCGIGTPERIATISIDGAAVASYHHVTENCSYETTYGYVGVISGSHTIATAVSSGNAIEVQGADALVMRLPIR